MPKHLTDVDGVQAGPEAVLGLLAMPPNVAPFRVPGA